MSDAMSARTITITGAGGDQIEAYLATADDPAPRGGVVVIHHMPGFDAGMKEITRRFAAEGLPRHLLNLSMCTDDAERIEVTDSGKTAQGWLPVTTATVYYDHPGHAQDAQTLNIDFLKPDLGRLGAWRSR